ncbi:hypothetical protein ACS0TY_015286 [Phlomoides rotata]
MFFKFCFISLAYCLFSSTGEKKVKKIQTYYRCNLRQSIKDLKDLQFREYHINEIKRTPLWFMFNAIYTSETDVLMKRCSKHEDDIKQIMLCFDDVSERFMIGGELLPLNNRDVQLILGVTGGADSIQLKRREHETPNWIKRCFRQEIDSAGGSSFILYKNHILEKLKVKLSSKDHTSIQDVARLTHSYLLVGVLLSNKNGSLALNIASYLEEFDSICRYNWCTVIVEMLKGQLNSSKRLKAGGCVMLLPFWLCEHITLIEPDVEDAFPRFLKWDLNQLSKKLLRVDVSKLDSRYIRKIDLKPTSSEKEKFESLLNYWEESSQATPEQATDVDGRDTEASRFLVKGRSVSNISKDNLRSRSGTPCTSDDLEQTIAIATRVEPDNVNTSPELKRKQHEKFGSMSTKKRTEFESAGSDFFQKFGDSNTCGDGLEVQIEPESNREIHVKNSSINTKQVLEFRNGGSAVLQKIVDSTICGDGLGVRTEPESNIETHEKVSSISTKEVPEFRSGGSDFLRKDVDSMVCGDELGVQSDKVVGILDEPSFKLNYSQGLTPNVELNQQPHGRMCAECGCGDVSKSEDQKRDAILTTLHNQIDDCKKIIGEKDFEIETLKSIQGEMKEKQESYLKEEIRKGMITEEENRLKLEADVQRLEKEKTDKKAAYEEELKKKDKTISDLSSENEQLLARVKQMTGPSSTQFYENPDNLARIDELEELERTKIAYNNLVKVHADLVEYVNIYNEIDKAAEGIPLEKTPCINKKKRTARHFSPTTLTKRVKNRTINQERKKLELTPQLNTNELVNIHEIPSDEDHTPIKELRLIKARPKFVLDESHWAVRKTTSRIKELAKDFWENNGPTHVVWTGVGPFAYVTVENVVDILHHGRIADRVIDSWGEILLETYAEKNVFDKISIFSSVCWGLISGGVSRNAGTLKNLVDVVLERLENQEF